jgi:hypothetical protein
MPGRAPAGRELHFSHPKPTSTSTCWTTPLAPPPPSPRSRPRRTPRPWWTSGTATSPGTSTLIGLGAHPRYVKHGLARAQPNYSKGLSGIRRLLNDLLDEFGGPSRIGHSRTEYSRRMAGRRDGSHIGDDTYTVVRSERTTPPRRRISPFFTTPSSAIRLIKPPFVSERLWGKFMTVGVAQ